MGYATYTQLYQSCVCPIPVYSWGFSHFIKSISVHNRAITYFLGVHKFSPVIAISEDMG